MELENFKYNLSRLKKCDQYWDEMSPVLGGRLCSKCEKKIIDFSNMTFSDIALHMSSSKEPVCGFYLPEQVKQTKEHKIQLPLAIGLSTLLTTPTFLKAQISPLPLEQHSTSSKQNENLKIEHLKVTDRNRDSINLFGSVFSFDTVKKTNIPISYATVIIKGTKKGVATMDNGEFSLPYFPTGETEKIYLVISSVGFISLEIKVELKDENKLDLGSIILEPSHAIEYYVITTKRSKWSKFWRKITKPFRR